MAYGLNSPCDATARRGVAGWLMLAGALALVPVYGLALKAALFPAVDEAYRRTFITREFGAYPTSPVFAGRNGLGYTLGSTVVFDAEKPRLILSRYDWLGWDDIGPYMAGTSGRIFLHMDDPAAIAGRALRLSLGLVCNLPKGSGGSLTVWANERRLGSFVCRRGAVTAHVAVPAGALGLQTYDEITLTREPVGWWERVKTRLGLRYDAVSLKQLTITARP